MSTDPDLLRSAPVASAIRERRLIAVLRRIEPREHLLALVDELVGDGISILEITFDAADAGAELEAVQRHLGGKAWVGAGTIRTRDHLRSATDAGAAFGVSPVLDREILADALTVGLPFIPGAGTATEADVAWRSGATFVKLFPGSSLGPNHVRELRGPMPEIETIVTGGVDAANAVAFLEAGAVAVGIGSALGRMGGAERRDLVRRIADLR